MPAITVPDHTYRRLEQKAARLHISVEHLVAPALQQVAEDEPALPLTGEAWWAELAAWKQDAASRAGRYPAGYTLDDSREAMYEDRLRGQM